MWTNKPILMSEAGPEGGEGSGGIQPTLDLNNPEIKATFQKMVDEQVAGLKTKNSELLGKIHQYKEKNGELERKMESLDGLDLDAVKGLLQKAQQDEEAKLIAQGKIDDVIQKRVANSTERMKADYEKKYNQLHKETEESLARANNFRGRVFSYEINKIANEVGLLPQAVTDAILRSREFFDIDDNANIVAKETAGFDEKGNKLTPKAWLESMKETAPHWFPVPKGTGAMGSGAGGSSAPRAWGEANSVADKVAFIKNKQKG